MQNYVFVALRVELMRNNAANNAAFAANGSPALTI